MSWLRDIAKFARQLIVIEQKVEGNTERIKQLRKEMNSLTEFSRRVAVIVERNQAEADGRHELLVAQLQNELLKLENKALLAAQRQQQDKGELPLDSVE